MLQAHDLSYKIGGKSILKEVSIEVATGEILVILGPNGAGKSTLLKALSGELPELSQQVMFNGLSLNSYQNRQLASLRAVMPQSVHLDFAFSVEEVVNMGVLSARPQEAKRRVLQALQLFDVAHLLDRNYLTLSGGEQQRVQLARVVVQILPEVSADVSDSNQVSAEGRYLLLDECTSSLDLAHQQQVFSVLKKLTQQQGIGIVAVLHDLNLASQYADRALLMCDGQSYAYDHCAEVLSESNISQVYHCPVDVIPREGSWSLVVPR